MKSSELIELPEQSVSHHPDIVKKQMLAGGSLPGGTQFNWACFSPGQIAAAHQHGDMHEVFFILSGRARFVVAGEDNEYGYGSCIHIFPGEMHEISNPSLSDPMQLLYFGVFETGGGS